MDWKKRWKMAEGYAYNELKHEIENLKEEMNDILADQNDINETTRAQLDAISTALIELRQGWQQSGRLLG
ncbi:MAG: hypothetical protein IKO73_01340 [Bacteroidaceae bacterium]|nr:hypothetical protein [Bacteroidaceae bacterium]